MTLDTDYADIDFHTGEQAVQQRAGVRAQMEGIAPLALRPFMAEQHRRFFAQLPLLLAGSIDTQGQPWASALAAPAGFIESPDERQLVVHALPLPGDPLAENLRAGASIGLLGIEPHTRRRNRANGVVRAVAADGFAVDVRQSFGNCPKYIQARRPHFVEPLDTGMPPLHRATTLDAQARATIARSDTLFIASAFPVGGGDAGAHGVDVSHRGGKPGFVRVDGADMLTMPDFSGNNYFNTLGNIAVHPFAGLLLIDFDNGDLLYVAAAAQIVWDGAELDAFEGARRLLRLRVREVRRLAGALNLRWSAAERSPALARTGAWPAVGGE